MQIGIVVVCATFPSIIKIFDRDKVYAMHAVL